MTLDLTKYEGHTPGPWAAFYKHKYDEWHVSLPMPDTTMKLALCPDGIRSANREPDAKLIADAPLLLAEIARLTRELSEYKAKGAAHIRLLAENNDTLRAELSEQGARLDRLKDLDAILRDRDKLAAELSEARAEVAQKWPKERAVGRVGDMAPREKSHMRVILDADNDVCVVVWDDESGRHANAAIEFCTLIGGGKSPRTREALIAVMVAMEADNAECPYGQFPPNPKAKPDGAQTK